MKNAVLQKFVKAVNSKNLADLEACLHERHLLIDAVGQELHGKKEALQAWNRYFSWFPDYKIEITDEMRTENVIAAFGYAGGTSSKGFRNKRWRIPAAWKIYLQQDTIKVWQIFADTHVQAQALG